jgi:hypothetical protein
MTEDGAVLSVLASRRTTSGGGASADDLDSSVGGGGASSGVRFEGLRLPRATVSGSPAGSDDGVAVGVVAAAPLGDAFVASAWAEGRPSAIDDGGLASGRALGWGVGLHSQPDAGGQAVGFVLARPTPGGPMGGGGEGTAPLLCEMSCRVPLADGLELTPGVMVVRAPGAGAATALRLGANWRF